MEFASGGFRYISENRLVILHYNKSIVNSATFVYYLVSFTPYNSINLRKILVFDLFWYILNRLIVMRINFRRFFRLWFFLKNKSSRNTVNLFVCKIKSAGNHENCWKKNDNKRIRNIDLGVKLSYKKRFHSFFIKEFGQNCTYNSK